MSWRRFGAIYTPSGAQQWARSHAALPTPLHLEGDVFRVLFSARDADNRSHAAYVDIELAEPPRLVGEGTAPVLAPGPAGSFDDSGVSIGCVVGRTLYYLGWNVGGRVPWRNTIGTADLAADFKTATRTDGPLLDRAREDPYSLSYPWLLQHRGRWRMWYSSSLEPEWSRSKMLYGMKGAVSGDGITWQRSAAPLAGLMDADDTAVARPCVIADADGGLTMWYALRRDGFRIACARSGDGETWTRDDRLGLLPTPGGFDSEETTYPCVFLHRGRLWMAYNGNGYGKTGFGFALWEGDLP